MKLLVGMYYEDDIVEFFTSVNGRLFKVTEFRIEGKEKTLVRHDLKSIYRILREWSRYLEITKVIRTRRNSKST